MSRRGSRSRFVGIALILGLATGRGPGERAEAQNPRTGLEAAPKPAETPKAPPESANGWAFDEEVAKTREDLENLKLWLTAKQAQLRAAEASTDVEHGIQENYDRMQKKGLSSPLRQKVAKLEVLEAESQRATILAEISDLQLRYNRTERYLKRLQQYGTSAMKSSDDQALELTEVMTRLKYAERMISKLEEKLKDTESDLRSFLRSKGVPD
jgi:DNA repair exonuclease SbcCD ATPase subunit